MCNRVVFYYIIIAPKRQPCTAAVGHWLHWTCKMFWMKRSLLSAFFALLCFRAAVGFFLPQLKWIPSLIQIKKAAMKQRPTRGLYFGGRCLRDIWVDIYLLKFQGKNVYVRDFLNAVKAGFAACVVVPSSHLLLRECIKRCCHEKKNLCDPVPTIFM